MSEGSVRSPRIARAAGTALAKSSRQNGMTDEPGTSKDQQPHATIVPVQAAPSSG